MSDLFGPRYSWRIQRFTPFLQGLVGGVHGFDAIFPNLCPKPSRWPLEVA